MYTLRNFLCGPLTAQRDIFFIKFILVIKWSLNALDFEEAGNQGCYAQV